MSSHFSKKPTLVRRGREEFFEPPERLAKYRALPGAIWADRTHVHFCAGEFFVAAADGLCRACRLGGACRSVKVSVLDITHAAPSRLPDIKRPPRPDKIVERAETSFATLAERKSKRLEIFIARAARERGLSRGEQAELRARLCAVLGFGSNVPRNAEEAFGPALAELFNKDSSGRDQLSRREIARSSFRASTDAELDAEIEDAARDLEF